jgi:thiol-disulfide isomerase/thioredoxin
MKRILGVCHLFAILLLAACGKTREGEILPPPVEPPIVKISKTSVIANDFDELEVMVVDKNGNDISARSKVTLNDVPITHLKVSTTRQGENAVRAAFNNIASAPAVFTGTDPGPSRFSKKILAEYYTGTWCGYCPRVARLLEQAEAANPKIIVAAVHNADGFASGLDGAMISKWKVEGLPTTVLNRKYHWNEGSHVLNDETVRWAPLGLAIESTRSGNTIQGKVKVNFDISTQRPLVLSLTLQEDGITQPQANFYNTTSGSPFFGLGNPIIGYTHNHILRTAVTDIFGDAMPAGVAVSGNIYERGFSFNIGGNLWNLNNCHLVAAVAYADGSGYTGVLNVQKVKVGQNKAFD